MAAISSEPLYHALLFVTGLLAGWINVLAGGGSNLTLPALMVMGMPPDVANATNRVAVVLQGIVGAAGFRRHGRLPQDDLWPLLWPTLVGAGLGAAAATVAPRAVLKPLLLGAMICMTLVIALKPAAVITASDEAGLKVRERPIARLWLLLVGVYGGFVQAGVGFLLIGVFGGVLRYDLVRANALKLTTVTAFTVVSLSVFLAKDLVLWVPGLVLSAGTVIGALAGVCFAIRANANTLRWLLLAMTLLGSAIAMLTS